MVWYKIPLGKNGFIVQQDSLVISDTLIFSDSLVLDTVPVLVKADSVSIMPVDTLPENPADTNMFPSLISHENVDTLEASRQDTTVPSPAVIQTEALPDIGPPAKEPVFVCDSILFQTDLALASPRISFPEDIFSLKELSDKSKQLDFFIYEKGHKGEAGINSTTKFNNIDVIPVQIRNSDNNSGWLLGVFLIIFILLARMKMLFGKFIPAIIKSSISYQAVQNLYRNRNSIYFQAGFNLDLIYFLSTSVFVFQLFRYFQLKPGLLSDFLVFLIAIASLFAWLILKYLIGKISGFVSLNTALFSEYFHSILIYNKTVGLFLIPVTLGITYINPALIKIFVFIGISIVAIAYVLQVIRLIQLFNSKSISSFYSILYLCALEILPVLLLVKVLFL